MARFWTLSLLLAGSLTAGAADFTVAEIGNDNGPGTARRPFRTLARAQAAVRELRAAAPQRTTPVTIDVRPGWFTLTEPLVFTPADGGTAASPTVWKALGGGDTVVSGGRKLTGWTVADGRWTLQLPPDQPLFSLLYVNSQPRYRPRLPKTGYYTIAADAETTPANKDKGGDRFGYSAGELRTDWHNLGDVEVNIFNEWNMARMRIASLDEANRIVTFTGPTISTSSWAMPQAGKRFVVDNVREALSEPGQWYLDSQTRVLTYLPRAGETPGNTTVVAPVLEQLLRFEGDAAADQLIRNITLDGFTFAHTNFICPPAGNSFYQAEANLPAAVAATGLSDSRIVGCNFVHLASYAFELNAGCRNNAVERCIFSDLGAGGVKLGTMNVPDDERQVSGWNTVRDCTLSHGGRLHPAGIGLWIAQSPYNTIEYNDIFDFYYTGISVGWSWGYGAARSDHNRIAHNRVWQIGQAVLSDMGGIYTLGNQEGSVIEHNLFHDIDAATYGGWGIYFDEGTTGILARDNLVYNTKTGGFHQHYGRDNTFENNIVAFSRIGQLQRTRSEEHHQFTIERCLIYYDEGLTTHGNWNNPEQYDLDYNLYWNAAGEPVEPGGRSWADWQAYGQDEHSIVADPLFVDPKKGDFRLRAGSPAGQIGFVPFPLEGWGSREARQAWALAPAVDDAFPLPGPPAPPEALSIDFEDQPVGQRPARFTVYEDATVTAATARVSAEAPASGTRCLKLTDAPGQQHSYNPHCVLNPKFNGGRVASSFDLKLGPGAELSHEWRDETRSPYVVGPTLRVTADGRLYTGDRELLTLPTNVWLHVHIDGPTGRHDGATWSLAVTLPDGTTQTWADLPTNPRFREFSWLGWTSQSSAATEMWIDNVSVQPMK